MLYPNGFISIFQEKTGEYYGQVIFSNGFHVAEIPASWDKQQVIDRGNEIADERNINIFSILEQS